MSEKPWGATPDDWTHFDVILGLREDLLPVVSNPNAVVSERSTIKALGKVPSLYNKDGRAVGISDWTQKRATAKEIEKWSAVSDYGICLQTKRVRALDIDVEDPDLAAEIESVIFDTLGFTLPKRYRADSAKRLFAFQVGKGLAENKRVLPVAGGIIEYLAIGQQFIAVGTHPKGARYKWKTGLPDDFPVIDIDALWTVLVDQFGTGDSIESGTRKSKGQIALPVADQTSESLEVLGIAKSVGREGQVYIECPWKHEHTDAGVADSETGTAYFPAGGRGYEMGHFRCLHAHCAGRSDNDFRVALGLEEKGGGFEALPPLENSEKQIALPLDFELRTNDDGKTLATVENLSAILSRPELCGHEIRYDTFRDGIVYKKVGQADWNPFKDTDYTKLRINLALTGFLPIGRELIRDVIHYVAGLHKVDTAQEWLKPLVWDGISRVENFLHKYMTAENIPYTKAVSLYMWVALAGRVMEPGCKADAAPIFVGEQYVGKSYAAESMSPCERFFTTIRFDDHEDNLARKMRGKLIAEFSELRGFHTKDNESIKDFISRRKEEWTPKYVEFTTEFHRRLLFIGTSNNYEFFSDETGNRRYFPVEVKKALIKEIINDRDQLWAEGRELFFANGVQKFYETANDLAHVIREKFFIPNRWDDTIYAWLTEKDLDGSRPLDKEFLRIEEIMRQALAIEPKNFKMFDMKEVGKSMRKFGYLKKQKRVGDENLMVWVKNIPM